MQLERLDVETVAKSYGLDRQNAHHALADAFLTARLWQSMLFALQKKGVRDFAKLLKFARAG